MSDTIGEQRVILNAGVIEALESLIHDIKDDKCYVTNYQRDIEHIESGEIGQPFRIERSTSVEVNYYRQLDKEQKCQE